MNSRSFICDICHIPLTSSLNADTITKHIDDCAYMFFSGVQNSCLETLRIALSGVVQQYLSTLALCFLLAEHFGMILAGDVHIL